MRSNCHLEGGKYHCHYSRTNLPLWKEDKQIYYLSQGFIKYWVGLCVPWKQYYFNLSLGSQSLFIWEDQSGNRIEWQVERNPKCECFSFISPEVFICFLQQTCGHTERVRPIVSDPHPCSINAMFCECQHRQLKCHKPPGILGRYSVVQ